MARALHAALLAEGVEPGTVFEGEDWEDRVIAATEMSHPQTIKSYTRAGRAIRLWDVEPGGGRGRKTKVTIRAPRVELVEAEPSKEEGEKVLVAA